MVSLRPFHEAVIDVIAIASRAELNILALLIMSTKIPANHDQVIEAWQKRREIVGPADDDLGVPASVFAQKPKPMTEEEMIKDTLDR
ncbi:MAG: hypothetical protein EXS48_00885 [Candidatus Staskawiczbacteria bacterium]|nr:hypothetical protein [Candidatus Staskawiczbacteria bacterium]